MSAGIDFFGADFGGKIGTEYSLEIKKDIEQTYSYDVYVEYTITCTAKPNEPGVGLMQWITESNDEQLSVHSLHTVCRYGDLYNQTPMCPWNACLGSSPDCSQCKDDWMTSDRLELLGQESSDSSVVIILTILLVMLLSLVLGAGIILFLKYRQNSLCKDSKQLNQADDETPKQQEM